MEILSRALQNPAGRCAMPGLFWQRTVAERSAIEKREFTNHGRSNVASAFHHLVGTFHNGNLSGLNDQHGLAVVAPVTKTSPALRLAGLKRRTISPISSSLRFLKTGSGRELRSAVIHCESVSELPKVRQVAAITLSFRPRSDFQSPLNVSSAVVATIWLPFNLIRSTCGTGEVVGDFVDGGILLFYRRRDSVGKVTDADNNLRDLFDCTCSTTTRSESRGPLLISSVAFAVSFASSLTVCNNAKPLLLLPARAASMVAFKASRFVCSAIQAIIFTTLQSRTARTQSNCGLGGSLL